MPIVAIFVVVILAGCGSVEWVSHPTGASPASLLVERARQVAPTIYGKDDRLLIEARNTCQDITEGKPRITVENNALRRFSTDTHPITADEAALLVQAARETVCK